MRFSGKVAIHAALVALGLFIMTIFTLDKPVLMTLAGAVAVVYAASVWSVLASRRHLVAVLAAAGSCMTVAFSVAFLRMWGLVFNEDAAALGVGVTRRDSDIYFYLAIGTGLLTLALLFVAAVWPVGTFGPLRKQRRQQAPTGPAARKPAAKRPTTTSSRHPSARQPAPRTPAASKATAVRKATPQKPVPAKSGPRKPAASRTK